MLGLVFQSELWAVLSLYHMDMVMTALTHYKLLVQFMLPIIKMSHTQLSLLTVQKKYLVTNKYR